MTRQTGGRAWAATSTWSMSSSRAVRRATARGVMPICCPSAPMRRTSGTRICSLMRGSRLSIAPTLSCTEQRPLRGSGRLPRQGWRSDTTTSHVPWPRDPDDGSRGSSGSSARAVAALRACQPVEVPRERCEAIVRGPAGWEVWPPPLVARCAHPGHNSAQCSASPALRPDRSALGRPLVASGDPQAVGHLLLRGARWTRLARPTGALHRAACRTAGGGAGDRTGPLRAARAGRRALLLQLSLNLDLGVLELAHTGLHLLRQLPVHAALHGRHKGGHGIDQ